MKNFTYTNICYVNEFAAINLSKTCSLKNAKETCQPNNRDLNQDLIKTTRILISEAVTGS